MMPHVSIYRWMYTLKTNGSYLQKYEVETNYIFNVIPNIHVSTSNGYTYIISNGMDLHKIYIRHSWSLYNVSYRLRSNWKLGYSLTFPIVRNLSTYQRPTE